MMTLNAATVNVRGHGLVSMRLAYNIRMRRLTLVGSTWYG